MISMAAWMVGSQLFFIMPIGTDVALSHCSGHPETGDDFSEDEPPYDWRPRVGFEGRRFRGSVDDPPLPYWRACAAFLHSATTGAYNMHPHITRLHVEKVSQTGTCPHCFEFL